MWNDMWNFHKGADKTGNWWAYSNQLDGKRIVKICAKEWILGRKVAENNRSTTKAVVGPYTINLVGKSLK